MSMNNLYTRTLAALVAVALALVAIVTPGPRTLDAQTSRYAVYATSRTTLTTTGRDLAVASSASSALSTLGGVATSRTIAGTALSSDISAATLRSGLSLPAAAASPSTTPLLLLSADSGVTDDGTGRCSQWVGTGSVGATFTAPSSGRRPLITSFASGGRKALYFDSTRTDTLTTSYSASLDPASALTVVAVVVVRSSSSVIFARPYTSTHTSPFAEWWLYAGGTTVDLRVAASTLTQAVQGVDGAVAWRRPQIYTYRLAAGARKLRISGYDVSTALTGATVAYTNNQGLRIGTNASDGEALTGWIMQLRLYSGSLTDAQVSEIEQSLSDYYGISLVFA